MVADLSGSRAAPRWSARLDAPRRVGAGAPVESGGQRLRASRCQVRS